jgi:hypothetical protein
MGSKKNSLLTRRRRRKKNQKLTSLTVAALGLQAAGFSLSLVSPAAGQSLPQQPVVRLAYADYIDYQKYEDRMHVHGPLFSFETPIAEGTALEGGFVLDSVSGASPLYLSTLSGASAHQIDDFRKSGDLKLTHVFDRFSLAAGVNGSDEEDYRSLGGLVESKIWTEDRNTIFSGSFAYSSDDITASNNPALDESRDNFEYLAGVTQVLSTVSLLQLNLTYANGDGYYSDPYKPFDNRPRSRDVYAALLRYNYLLSSLDAALHTDLRVSKDSWGISSEMFEFAWYQPLGTIWTLRPHLRYYTQSDAAFFRSFFPPDDRNSLYTADQRLSAFGSLTLGLTVICDITSDLAVDAGIDYLQQRSDYRLFSDGSEGIDPLYARFITIGLTKKFQ